MERPEYSQNGESKKKELLEVRKMMHVTLIYFSICFISSFKVAVVLLSNIYIGYFEKTS